MGWQVSGGTFFCSATSRQERKGRAREVDGVDGVVVVADVGADVGRHAAQDEDEEDAQQRLHVEPAVPHVFPCPRNVFGGRPQ